MYDKNNPPKFPMHNMHLNQTIRTICSAGIVSCTAGVLFYFLYILPRQGAYRAFYSNYDPNASFKRMMEAGVLDSCPKPEPPPPPPPPDDKKKK